MSHWTRAGLQRETGRNRSEIDRLLALGLPHEQVGQGRGGEIRIDRVAAVAWMVARLLDEVPKEGSLDYNAEKARLTKEQADKTELENRVARGELVNVEAVLKSDEIIFAALRDRIMAVTSIAPTLRDAALADDVAGVRIALRAALAEALDEVGSAEVVEIGAGSDAAAV